MLFYEFNITVQYRAEVFYCGLSECSERRVQGVQGVHVSKCDLSLGSNTFFDYKGCFLVMRFLYAQSHT